MPTTASLMSGTETAAEIVAQCRNRATAFHDQFGRRPCLATVLVGDDPASIAYVRMKQRRCETAAIDSRRLELADDSTTADVDAIVRSLSDDPEVDGILVQHPVPTQVDERAVFVVSSTPGGILRLLDAYEVDLEGSHAVVIGRSPILGRPVGMLLLDRDATVTYCHSRTRDLSAIVATADVIVAAVGIPNFVRGEWIRPGAVVIDAGYNEGNVGDVAFDEAVAHARLITPVPGGVGPMTIALLLEQTVDAAFAGATVRS